MIGVGGGLLELKDGKLDFGIPPEGGVNRVALGKTGV
jgi:hypothetical protein